MRSLLTVLALAIPCLGAAPKQMVWKRIGYDPAGAVAWIDSLAYDGQAKLLVEYRRSPDGVLIHTVQHHYDDSGRAARTVKLGPDDGELEAGACSYEGRKLRGFTRTEANITMDGISFSLAGDTSIVYAQSAMVAYSFKVDKRGRATGVRLMGGMQGGMLAEGVFEFDKAGRHSATRFFGADHAPIGRDSLVRDAQGRLRELHRFDAKGKLVGKVERGYDTRGNIIRKSYADADGRVVERMDMVWLSADSLRRLGKEASEWKGRTVTADCDLQWFRNIDLGIEMATAYGLIILPRLAAGPQAKPVDPIAFRDSVDREVKRQQQEVKEKLAILDACRRQRTLACIDKAWTDLDSFRNGELKWSDAEVLDSTVALLLEAGAESAYARLLSGERIDSTVSLVDRTVIDRLLKFRLAMAYRHFEEASRSLPRPAPWKPVIHPGAPKNLPVPLAEAWSYRRSVYDEGPKPEFDTSAGVKWTYAELYRHLLEFLRSENIASLDAIKRYHWEGWCGTGSEALEGPKEMAGLIVALDRGDFHRALRATNDAEEIRRMLMSRGRDWESFFLGAWVDGDYNERERAGRILAKHGSLDAVRKMLLENPKTSSGYPPNTVVEILGVCLLGPGARLKIGEDDYSFAFYYVRDTAAPKLTPELRQQALDRLRGFVDDNPFRLDELTFVRIFTGLDFPGKGDCLRKLAEVPSPSARKMALEALKQMGQKAGKLPPLDRVNIKVTSGGRPFPYGSFTMTLPCPDSAKECPTWGSSSSIEGGTYPISRKQYLDAWRTAKALRFYNLYAGYENPLDAFIYNVTLPIQETPAEPIVLDIPMHRFTLQLEFPAGFEPKQEAKMTIQCKRLEKAAESYGSPFDIPLRKNIVFTHLGDGSYSFSLIAPGLQGWESGPIDIKGDGVVNVKMRKGVNVR
jgi:hypothetical protein